MPFGMLPTQRSKVSRSPPRFRHPRHVGPRALGKETDSPRPEARDLADQSPKRKQRHFQVSAAEAEAQVQADQLERLADQALADLLESEGPPAANRETASEFPPPAQRDPEGARDSLVSEQATQAADTLLGPGRGDSPL